MEWPDKIIWINHKSRADRFRNMTERFKALGIEAERFNAIYGGEIDFARDKKFQGYHINKQTVKRKLNNAEIGCFLSHCMIWEMIKENGWKKTLILEDDALFCDGFKEFVKELKVPDYDMLYFGQWNYDKGVIEGERSALKEKVQEIGEHGVYAAQRCWLTHAYMVDLSVIDKLLSNSKNLYASVDCVLADIQEKENLKVYAIHPAAIKQDRTKSSLRS